MIRQTAALRKKGTDQSELLKSFRNIQQQTNEYPLLKAKVLMNIISIMLDSSLS
jgi:hypothetical protein